ncbi:MAG TPA: pyrroloquinoline quinone-dependent dehydrogenase [Terriglobales bacterium]|jgi:quinoprotein glucose dehydrogenase|nr:pyrroloquinoline quinone-dependent dehydrogenase [Terriglobales bacterium]
MKKCKRVNSCCVAVIIIFLGATYRGEAQASAEPGWPTYGNDRGGMRYSSATQIDRTNVARLKVAWTYRTGANDTPTPLVKKAAFEATPILVNGVLFLSTPYNHVIALNAQSGAKLWEYDPRVDLQRNYSEVASRGVSVWRDSKAKSGQQCSLRIFAGTLDARLLALDAASGKPCADFGTKGEIDLNRDAATQTEWTGGYQVTSAPAIAGDLVIVGSSIADNWKVDTGRGIVRAFDARTGKLRWTWDPIPWAQTTHPRTGGGNAWSTISVDAERDLAFIPTSSAAPDYYGGGRKGDNKWANSVVALRASTGEFVWGFQVVHHDLWDFDVAAQPTLFTWKDGTPAVVVNTKMGHVFVLSRLTGAPLLPVEERPVPMSDITGEESWPTQPFSTISLVPEKIDTSDAWGPTPEDLKWCQDKLKASRAEGIFTPPSLRGTATAPGNVGGVNWGGAAYDAQRHLMFVNTNRLAAWAKLIPRADYASETRKDQDNRIYGEFGDQDPAPFGLYRTFLFSPSKLPCNAPPWGTVTAVDLFAGKKLWETPLGTFIPGKNTGTINLGGPMASAGGLVFTSAAMDNFLRAFDSETGKELWSFELPAGGQATPMTYSINGKQYLVICAGGHGKLGTKQGDFVMAFALP